MATAHAFWKAGYLMAFVYPVSVRYVECDMQGHVFNGNYLSWLDMAHGALMAEVLGLSHDQRIAAGVDFVVAECGLCYRAPAHFGDELLIEVSLEPPTASSLTSRFVIRRADHAITTAFVRHVCVNASGLRKRAWPDAMRASLLDAVTSLDHGRDG